MPQYFRYNPLTGDLDLTGVEFLLKDSDYNDLAAAFNKLVDGALTGTPRVAELQYGGTPYYFKVYPTYAGTDGLGAPGIGIKTYDDATLSGTAVRFAFNHGDYVYFALAYPTISAALNATGDAVQTDLVVLANAALSGVQDVIGVVSNSIRYYFQADRWLMPGVDDDDFNVPTIIIDTWAADKKRAYLLVDNTPGAAVYLPLGAVPTHTTKITVTGTIAANTNFSTTSSGANYTKAGDDGDLRADEPGFHAAPFVQIYLNGVLKWKGSGAVWKGQTSFRLDTPVDSGDEIIVLS